MSEVAKIEKPKVAIAVGEEGYMLLKFSDKQQHHKMEHHNIVHGLLVLAGYQIDNTEIKNTKQHIEVTGGGIV